MPSSYTKANKNWRVPNIRLKTWDYTLNGWYFVTICTNDKETYFGNIQNNKMELFEAGQIAYKYWLEIPMQFPYAKLDEFIVMPNHIHGIIVINNMRRADINVGPTKNICINNPMTKQALGRIIRWYKGRCAYEIHKIDDLTHFKWQYRYYDHIIRDEKSLQRIREYIKYNLHTNLQSSSL